MHIQRYWPAAVLLPHEIERLDKPSTMIPMSVRKDDALDCAERKSQTLTIPFDTVSLRSGIEEKRVHSGIDSSSKNRGQPMVRTANGFAGPLGHTRTQQARQLR